MTALPLANLHDDPANARRIVLDDLDGLTASMSLLGQLQPIIVRPDAAPDHWLVVAGRRRVRAAERLGWEMIAAMPLPDVSPAAASAAENMVRARMHAVDQWRAIVALTDDGGYTVESAAAALGIDTALARRLRWLGGIEPSVLDVMGRDAELPPTRELKTIALAAHDAQVAALAQAMRHDGTADWYAVARACAVHRVPMARAIFDVAGSGIVVDEDLFAEPGSDEQFTTADVAGFLDQQAAALEAEAARPKSRLTVLPYDAQRATIRQCLPKGWEATWDDEPKRWRKDDRRRVFAWVTAAGYRLGLIDRVVAEPADDRAVQAAAERAERLTPPAPSISKAVQGRLAVMKGEAVRERLNVFRDNGPADMLRALLMVFALQNVSVRGGADIPAALVDAGGAPRPLDEDRLCQLAAHIIGNAVVFDAPDQFHGSGPAAEWLATLIGAEMPRCDTPEVLRGFPLAALSAAAVANGIPGHGTATVLRKRMAGAMPDWRPVAFGAPGPLADDDDTEFAEVGEHPDDADMEHAA